jgi:hypothetical protein
LEGGDKVPKVCLLNSSLFFPSIFYSFLLPVLQPIPGSAPPGSGPIKISQFDADCVQEQEIKRTVNLANSLSAIVPLTSLYIPLRSPPSRLPAYVILDNTSKWHTMGLLSVAMETCTLPTRDNTSTGSLGRLGDMTTLLNVSGNQKIASLAMSIYKTEIESKTPDHSPVSPATILSQESAPKIELSWETNGTRVSGKEIGKDGHIFAEAEVLRGFNEETVRARQKTDQNTAQRKARLAHDRQDAILGRWGIDFCSFRTIIICFAFLIKILHLNKFRRRRKCGKFWL